MGSIIDSLGSIQSKPSALKPQIHQSSNCCIDTNNINDNNFLLIGRIVFTWIRGSRFNQLQKNTVFLLTYYLVGLPSNVVPFYFDYLQFIYPSHLLGKGWHLGSRLWCLIIIVFLSLSHVVSWVRCGTWLYRFLIFAPILSFKTKKHTWQVTAFLFLENSWACSKDL